MSGQYSKAVSPLGPIQETDYQLTHPSFVHFEREPE